MLVAQLTAPREFCLTQQEIEDPPPGQVQVRADSVGICGSVTNHADSRRVGARLLGPGVPVLPAHCLPFGLGQFAGVALQAGAWHGHQVLVHILAGTY